VVIEHPSRPWGRHRPHGRLYEDGSVSWATRRPTRPKAHWLV